MTQLIHCSYHKCLTVYYRRVMDAVLNKCLFLTGGYRHYNSHLLEFNDGFRNNKLSSINNRALALDQLDDYRISRFIRDPRDLVISGYYYHLRGAENWVTIANPQPEDWYFANAEVPQQLRNRDGSYTAYLNSVPMEEGLLAEMELRAAHFRSMTEWPKDDKNILLLRYEDVLSDGTKAFDMLFDHYRFSEIATALGRYFARRYSIQKQQASADQHIRNPSTGQWREHFTPRVRQTFNSKYSTLLKRYDYPIE